MSTRYEVGQMVLLDLKKRFTYHPLAETKLTAMG